MPRPDAGKPVVSARAFGGAETAHGDVDRRRRPEAAGKVTHRQAKPSAARSHRIRCVVDAAVGSRRVGPVAEGAGDRHGGGVETVVDVGVVAEDVDGGAASSSFEPESSGNASGPSSIPLTALTVHRAVATPLDRSTAHLVRGAVDAEKSASGRVVDRSVRVDRHAPLDGPPSRSPRWDRWPLDVDVVAEDVDGDRARVPRHRAESSTASGPSLTASTVTSTWRSVHSPRQVAHP